MPVLVIFKFYIDVIETKWAMPGTTINSGFFSTQEQVTGRMIVYGKKKSAFKGNKFLNSVSSQCPRGNRLLLENWKYIPNFFNC